MQPADLRAQDRRFDIRSRLACAYLRLRHFNDIVTVPVDVLDLPRCLRIKSLYTLDKLQTSDGVSHPKYSHLFLLIVGCRKIDHSAALHGVLCVYLGCTHCKRSILLTDDTIGEHICDILDRHEFSRASSSQ